jgi:hypothetical protein
MPNFAASRTNMPAMAVAGRAGEGIVFIHLAPNHSARSAALLVCRSPHKVATAWVHMLQPACRYAPEGSCAQARRSLRQTSPDMLPEPHVCSAAHHSVTIHTRGSTRAWKRRCPALIASTRARCSCSQEKNEHVRHPRSRQIRNFLI